MDIESNRKDSQRGDIPSPQFRPKPFLTILDGKPVAKNGRPHARRRAAKRETGLPALKNSNSRARSSKAFNPVTLIKKSRTIIRSYADAGAHTITSGFKGGFIAAVKTVSGFRKALDSGTKPALFKLAAAQFRPAAEDSASDEPRFSNPAQASSEAATPVRNKKNLSSFLAAFKPAAIRAPRIILAAVIAVAALSAGAAAIIGAKNFPVTPGSLLLPDEDSVQMAMMSYIEPDGPAKGEQALGPLPPIPVSVSIRSYTAKSGDTIEKIAKRFGLRQDTIISSNNLQSASSLRVGVQLRIPNMDGISHKVRSGDSLSSLAKTYAIDITRIVDANDLASGTISLGQSLFIPNARLSSASLRNFYGERFIWPARGRISSPFGYRANPFTGLRTYHSAIDIVVSLGTKVKATNDGSVADTGYNSVFGNYIILKHASGYQSLYAHLSSILVKEGTSVSQGAVIGLSGNTGQSTGPHLHFSIFKNGQALDPTKYVK